MSLETLKERFEKVNKIRISNYGRIDKAAEEFQNNMCEHRCILYNEIEELRADLFEEKEKYKRLQNTEAFQECYISKDKIKNILDKFNKGEYHYIHDLMQEIQELLEEK